MIEIIVGREEKKEKPRLALTKDGETKYYGEPGSVPKSVSRKHCRLLMNDDNTLSITDITSDNFMYINGKECKSRGRVTLKDTVELGPARYRLDLQVIMQAYAAQQTYSIRHLERIYKEYDDFKIRYETRQGKFNAVGTLPGLLMMSSALLAIFNERIRTVMLVFASAMAVLFAIIRIRKADSNPRKKKAVEDKFHDEYVCPNPMCQHFLGTMQYKDIRKLNNCPYCKAKWTE